MTEEELDIYISPRKILIKGDRLYRDTCAETFHYRIAFGFSTEYTSWLSPLLKMLSKKE